MGQFQLTEFGTVNGTRTPENPVDYFRGDDTLLHEVLDFLHRDISYILFESSDQHIRIFFPNAQYCVHDEPVFEQRDNESAQWKSVDMEERIYFYDIGALTVDLLEEFVEYAVAR